jgi:hypothetical protein
MNKERLTKPGMGFFSFETAWRTLQGFEVMNIIRKGQLQRVDKEDVRVRVALSPGSSEWLLKLNKEDRSMFSLFPLQFLQHYRSKRASCKVKASGGSLVTHSASMARIGA